MSEALVVGIIADTSNPAAVARLLRDLGRLAAVDPGLSRIDVVVLENPSGEPDPQASRALSPEGVAVHRIGRASQGREAAGRSPPGSLEVLPGRLSIATARTLVQLHAAERAGEDAAVWILDEDLRLLPLLDGIERGEPPLSARVCRLRAERVDVAVGRVIGAPPLPARSTVRVNLEDVRRHLDLIAALDPDAQWPDLSADNARVRRALPEYYYDLSRAHGDAGAHPMWLERAGPDETVRSAFARLADGIDGLADGVPITRTLVEDPAQEIEPSPLARGGNTLVLRPALLARIPNLALRVGARVSRRSDMLWARLAVAIEGARLARAPVLTLQDRSGPGRSSFDFDKLLDDVRGSAVIAALDGLIGEGALTGELPPPRDAVARASAVYVASARERLAAIDASEERVRSLLDQIVLRVRAPEGDPRFLGHPAHAESIDRLLAHAAQLRSLYSRRPCPFDPAAERSAVEGFLLGLLDEVHAHRMGPGRANDRAHPIG